MVRSKAEAKEREVAALLRAWRGGNARARDALFAQLYDELTLLSAAMLRSERHSSLATGDLVHDAAARLIGLERIDWQSKAHFMALAATMMRRVLIDDARRKGAGKRAHQRVTLITQVHGERSEALDLRRLEAALIRLAAIDPLRVQIVEMRYFVGMSLEDIAVVTGMSPSSIKRNWRASRAWLMQAMEDAARLDAEAP